MASVYFLQKDPVELGHSKTNKTVVTWRLPRGYYVVIAKFVVVAESGPDNAGMGQSRFQLKFGGATDDTYVGLRPGEVETAVLQVAGGRNPMARRRRESPGAGTVFLKCLYTGHNPINVKWISITAMPVDKIEA